MARVTAFLLLIGLVATAWSQDDNPFAWEISDGVTIEPTYDPDSGAIGISITFEFKRSADQPTKVGTFSLIDSDGDGFLTVEEWHAQKGGVINFAKFLQDLDKDGDETISLDEFQAVKHVYTKN